MEGLGNGLLAFHLVEALAHVFVGKQLGAEHPDFLGVVSRVFDVDLVGHFHHADVFAHLLDGFIAGVGRLVEVEFLELPEVAVVVAVGRGEQIGARAERQALVGLQPVRQRDADVPRNLVVVQAVLRGGEQGAALGNPRIGVFVAVVEQGAGEAVEVVAHAVRHVGRGAVQLGPKLLQSGETADGQGFHPRVFDHADDRHLIGRERLGGDGGLGLDHMRGAVCGGGSVQLQAGHTLVVVVGVGQVQQIVFDIGLVAFAAFKVARGRAHEKVARPQRPQVHIDAPLHVHQQRALALFLQHGERLLALQAEVGDLFLVVGAMRVRTPQRPAPQAAQGELGEQHVELVEHGPHAARGLRDEYVDELQVVGKQLGIAQSVGRRRRGGEQAFDDCARGFGGQGERGGGEFAHHILAHFLGHQRRVVEPVFHQRVALAQAAQRPRALEVVVEAARAEHLGGVGPDGVQHLQGVRRKVFEIVGVIVEGDGHGCGSLRAGKGQKKVETAASSASRMSGSSVMGRTSATRQAALASTPLAMRLPA